MIHKHRMSLELMGFTFPDVVLEENFSYQDATLSKNDCELLICTEYDETGEYVLHYVEFNGEKLNGREIEITDILMLKRLM